MRDLCVHVIMVGVGCGLNGPIVPAPDDGMMINEYGTFVKL